MLEPERPRFRLAQPVADASIDRDGPLGVRIAAAGTELALDLAQGARVRLAPNSALVLLSAERAGVLLVRGSMHVQLLPQARGIDQPSLRVIAGEVALSVPASAELWLALPEPHAPPFVVVLAGSAELERAGPDGALVQQPLTAGWALARGTVRQRGTLTLSEAKQEAVALAKRSVARRPADPPTRALTALADALDAFEGIERRARELLQEQRAAKQRGDAAAAQAQQRALVALAQDKLAARKRLRLAYELACARLASGPGPEPALADFDASFGARAKAALFGSF